MGIHNGTEMKNTKWNRNGIQNASRNAIHNGTDMDIRNGTEIEYKMEQTCKYNMEQKWNTKWNSNVIHTGTEM